jgi:hypothetical protein
VGLRWKKQLEAGKNNILSFMTRNYPIRNIIRVIKSRNMSWVGHVARKGQKRDAYWIFL